MNLAKEDFYCGAFLSFLLNNKIVPALFEERVNSSRKIYDFTTDKGGFRVYVKGSEKPSSESQLKKSSIWNFPFTEKQIDEIKGIESEEKQMYFAFVCGKIPLNKSRIAVIPADILFQCIDIDRSDKYKSQSVKIKLVKGCWDFEVYGTARADRINGLDNTLKVRVKNIDELFSKEVMV
ncbi:hypothetical protein [Aneurinibacillus aneurinilyticus]|uniref:Uncharacterized protein n=1 Tax=Aneurinibacillus aneurinilyticus TaxID=1391 RepID=A0A848D052_ANEAE|nr:hypothetical protein [Aneurinibacillus aneurinilyticus]NME99232.1 hypothetical protein [Aneurinibacillus aneurinilyticus]